MALTYSNIKIVFFDLEATGLDVTDEIIQIGAVCGYNKFNEYINPTISIPKSITKLTGISKIGEQMYHRDEKVNSSNASIVIDNFLTFLKSLNSKLILVAHNCFKFDGPMLTGLIDKLEKIHIFKSIVTGFSDTFPLLKKTLPQKRENGEGYKLVQLAEEFSIDISGAHGALDDAIILQKLISLTCIYVSAKDIVDSRKIVGDMTHTYKCRLDCYRRRLSYENEEFYYSDD